MPRIPQHRKTRRNSGASNPLKRWGAPVVVVLITLFIMVNQHGLYRLYQLRSEQEQLEVEIRQLQATANELNSEKSKLQENLEYIERLAREKYRMVKRGEKVFRVINSDSQPAPMESESGN